MISELDAARLDVLQVSEYAINRKDRDNQRDSKADFLIHRASMSVERDDAWLPASWLCFPTPVPVTVTGARPARLNRQASARDPRATCRQWPFPIAGQMNSGRGSTGLMRHRR